MGKSTKIILAFLTSSLIVINFFISSYAITIPKVESFSRVTDKAISKFLGKWIMQSIVTESNCQYVFIGTTTESNLEIKPILNQKNGEFIFKTQWDGGNWKKSTGTMKILNDKEAISERVTEYLTQDKNLWKAILIDHFKVSETDTIHSDSLVIQYKNGLNVGEYKTYSILTKIDE